MARLSLKSLKQGMCYFCGSYLIAKSRKRRQVQFWRLHNYYQCCRCKGYSLFPKLNNYEIEDLYSTNYIVDVNPNFGMQEQITLNRFLELSETLSKYPNLEDKSFLDYGCGATAEVVILADRLGYKAYGVEVEVGTREEAQKRSNCPILSPFEMQSTEVKFDVIFLGDVLEHLNNPLETLSEIRNILSPDGILIIQGPLEGAATLSNILLSMKSILIAKSPSKFPPYHVSLASKKSILKVLAINDLTIRRLKVTEPMWPAPRFGSKDSFTSVTALIFSLTKVIDILISRAFSRYGTRFFLIASKH